MVSADRVEAELAPFSLLEREIRISSARAFGVKVATFYDAEVVCYPIPKAAPEAPPGAASADPGWVLRVDDFYVEGTGYQWGPIGGPPDWELSAASLRLAMRMDSRELKLFVKEASGVPGGLSAGVYVRGELSYIVDRFIIDKAEVRVGSSRLYAEGELREFADVYIDLDFAPGYVVPSDLRRLLPELPVAAPL